MSAAWKSCCKEDASSFASDAVHRFRSLVMTEQLFFLTDSELVIDKHVVSNLSCGTERATHEDIFSFSALFTI